mmetsp:Transcript_79330/g.224369  ORF Transcript_79330/g.224369 Transcript_79330/m.224369 type:complete len:114 (-) Transcript_79330:115-456(-)
MAARRAPRATAVFVLAAALLVSAWVASSAFVPQPAPRAAVRGPAGVSAGLLASAAAAAPALAGEPPSVGEHWYWDLGFGSLHGETASIILLVFFLLLVLSILGAGGSSKKSAA